MILLMKNSALEKLMEIDCFSLFPIATTVSMRVALWNYLQNAIELAK